MSEPRPIPDEADPLYADHLAGLRAGSLRAQICSSCQHVQWPPRELCLRCGSSELHGHQVEIAGTVYTFSVCHRAFHPYFADRIPYGIVVVEVGDGATDGPLRFVGTYASDLSSLRCGVPVVASTEWTDDHPFLQWTAAS